MKINYYLKYVKEKKKTLIHRPHEFESALFMDEN
jgi:hypothetical protein